MAKKDTLKNADYLMFATCIVMFLLFSCNEQKVTINYFDDNPPDETPKKFAPELISIEGRKEGNGVFTPNGKQFFYIEVGDSNELSIMQMDYKDDSWSAPQKATFSDKGDNAEPFITYDGKSIFFVSNRSTGKKWNGRIWRSDLTENDWSAPSLIDIPIQTEKGLWFPSYSTSGKLYFGAYLDSTNNYGKSDIYYYDLQSKALENLGPNINTPHEEWDPFIASDDSYLLFASDRPGGFGKVDNYISFRTNDGWSKPYNLGNAINSEEFDVAAKVTPDHKYIFFDRPTKGEQDIYWVSANIIDKLKKD